MMYALLKISSSFLVFLMWYHRLLIGIIFLLGSIGVYCQDPTSHSGNSPSNLIVLTDANFDEYTRHGSWILDFYAPWCGHCKKLHPVIESVAQLYANNPSKEVYFGLVDCTEQTQLKSRFNVRGYPTVMYYRNGVSKLYRHARTAEGFQNFIEEMTKPSVSAVANQSHLQGMLKNSEGEHQVVFMYLGPPGEPQQAFQAAADALQGIAKCVSPSGMLSKDALNHAKEVAIAAASNAAADSTAAAAYSAKDSAQLGVPEEYYRNAAARAAAMNLLPNNDRLRTTSLITSLAIEESALPVIIALSPGQQNLMYSGKFVPKDVEAWMVAHQLPLITTLTPATFEPVMNTGKLAVLLVTAEDPAGTSPQSVASKAYIDSFLPVAASYQEKFTFATMSGVKFPQYLQQFGITSDMLPTLLAIAYNDDLYYLDELGVETGTPLRSQSAQIDFLEGILDGRVQPKATTAWYSPQRYVKMLERWIKQVGETQLLVIIGLSMFVFMIVAGFVCWRVMMNDSSDDSLSRLEEDQKKVQEKYRRQMQVMNARRAAAAADAGNNNENGSRSAENDSSVKRRQVRKE